jgi:hypothetical protein
MPATLPRLLSAGGCSVRESTLRRNWMNIKKKLDEIIFASGEVLLNLTGELFTKLGRSTRFRKVWHGAISSVSRIFVLLGMISCYNIFKVHKNFLGG